MLLNPTNPSNQPQLRLTQAAAATLGMTLLAFEAKRADAIDRAFVAIKTERAGALIVIGDPLLGTHAKRIVELSTRNRLPAIYWIREFPDAGGLMYRIGPEDQLLISVWKFEVMSQLVMVRPDGKISLPLINDVQAAGLTALELRDATPWRSLKESLGCE